MKIYHWLLSLLIFVLYSDILFSQDDIYQGWVACFENARVNAMEMDLFGNIYLVGKCKDDLLVAKYNKDGQLLWNSTYNGANNGADEGYDIIIDNAGYVTVTGFSEEIFINITIDEMITRIDTIANIDIITIQYNSDGDEMWKSIYNSYSNKPDEGKAIAKDNFGNIYIAGNSYDQYHPSWRKNIILIKYDSHGYKNFTQSYNHLEIGGYYSGPEPKPLINDYTNDMEVKSNSVYLLGTSQTGKHTGTIIKYNTEDYGKRLWYRQIDRVTTMTDMGIDEHGNIFVSGYGSYKSGSYDYVIAKYDTSGNEKWIKSYSGKMNSDDACYSLDFDTTGSVYVTGYTLNNISVSDITTIKYDSIGNQQWVRNYSGNSFITRWDNVGNKVICDKSNSIYVAGRVRNMETGYDFALIKYDTSGDLQLSKCYNYKEDSNDAISDIKIYEDYIYVTGNCDNNIVTIKYTQKPPEINNEIQNEYDFVLYQNYPNPFNESTVIRYNLKNDSFVELNLFNLKGELIKKLFSGYQLAGTHDVNLNDVNITSGLYCYSLVTENYQEIKKCLLLK